MEGLKSCAPPSCSALRDPRDLELEQQQLFDGPDIEGTHVEYHHLCLGLRRPSLPTLAIRRN